MKVQLATPLEIGKAYLAHNAYNKHARKNARIPTFVLSQWLNVVRSLGAKTEQIRTLSNSTKKKVPTKRWTPEHYKKFDATIAARRKAANGA